MGSGISLSDNQVAEIIERELFKEYYETQKKLEVFTYEGYEIYRDFSDDVKLNDKIQKVYMYVKYNPKCRNQVFL
jgi:predicted dithiol-disulfide oxidoreductase (DUF899 family)